jgi:hypothetical protein
MIPTYLEQLIHQGKAEQKTFSCAMAENVILKVPDKTYIIIYEYWYKPLAEDLGETSVEGLGISWRDRIQFVNFFNQNGFQAFWHEFNPDYVQKAATNFPTTNPALAQPYYEMTTKQTDYRTLYLKADRDLSIYFSRLNADNASASVAALPALDPANNYFGYEGLNVGYSFSGYHGLIASGINYTPLNSPITNVINPATAQDITNQVYTIPTSGGALPDFTSYGEAPPGSALGKARAHHFQCNYVQVNIENPANLI